VNRAGWIATAKAVRIAEERLRSTRPMTPEDEEMIASVRAVERAAAIHDLFPATPPRGDRLQMALAVVAFQPGGLR